MDFDTSANVMYSLSLAGPRDALEAVESWRQRLLSLLRYIEQDTENNFAELRNIALWGDYSAVISGVKRFSDASELIAKNAVNSDALQNLQNAPGFLVAQLRSDGYVPVSAPTYSLTTSWPSISRNIPGMLATLWDFAATGEPLALDTRIIYSTTIDLENTVQLREGRKLAA